MTRRTLENNETGVHVFWIWTLIEDMLGPRLSFQVDGWSDPKFPR
jgi:hypothetical protein